MQDNSKYADWYGPHYFSLKSTHRVGERWWGNCADEYQAFRAEPCLTIQLSLARPWLRIAAGYRLRTNDLYDAHIAIVPSRWAASKLLANILGDIKTFPISKARTSTEFSAFDAWWELAAEEAPL